MKKATQKTSHVPARLCLRTAADLVVALGGDRMVLVKPIFRPDASVDFGMLAESDLLI